MIDLHAHVLPALDDGPADLEAALDLGHAAVSAGTTVMAATPHISHRYPTAPTELHARIGALQVEFDRAGIPLLLVAGGELAPAKVLDLSADDLASIALGGSNCILLECPFAPAGHLLAASTAALQSEGYRVLLAHPERSPDFASDPRRLAPLIEAGALAQLTVGSLSGAFGKRARRACQAMLVDGLAHVVASDAHDADSRSPALWEPVRDALGEDLADWLASAVPQAILNDAPLPARPPRPRRATSRWWR